MTTSPGTSVDQFFASRCFRQTGPPWIGLRVLPFLVWAALAGSAHMRLRCPARTGSTTVLDKWLSRPCLLTTGHPLWTVGAFGCTRSEPLSALLFGAPCLVCFMLSAAALPLLAKLCGASAPHVLLGSFLPSFGEHGLAPLDMRTEPPAPAPASCVDSGMPASVPAVDTGHYQAVCSRPVPTPCRNFRMPDCPWPLLAGDDSEAGDDDHDLDFAVLAGAGEAPTLGLGGISAVVFRTLLCEAVSDPSCAALAVAAATLSVLAEAFPSPCAPAQSVNFPSGPSEPKNQGFGAFPEKTARQEGEIPNPSSFLGRFSLAESRQIGSAEQSFCLCRAQMPDTCR